jgi:hypothetical protein
METMACTQWRGVHLVDGAGHWVQQEQSEEVSRLLLQFIDGWPFDPMGPSAERKPRIKREFRMLFAPPPS